MSTHSEPDPKAREHSFAQQVRRSLLLFFGTIALALLGPFLAHLLGDFGFLALPLMLVAALPLAGGPFFLVPLHYRLQSPPNSSVLLAFATGLGSFAVVLAVILWWLLHHGA